MSEVWFSLNAASAMFVAVVTYQFATYLHRDRGMLGGAALLWIWAAANLLRFVAWVLAANDGSGRTFRVFVQNSQWVTFGALGAALFIGHLSMRRQDLRRGAVVQEIAKVRDGG